MSTPDNFRPLLESLAGHQPEGAARSDAEYRRLQDQAHDFITEHPEIAAAVIEFQFINSSSEAIRLEAIGLLYRLGADPDQRGRATELLGLAEQDDSARVRKQARRAVNGLSRRRLGDGKRRGERPLRD